MVSTRGTAPGPGGEELVFESDWLASRPFFYNVRTGAAGANVNDVVDLANAELDAEGLNDFLDFGFSVFERTPVRDVRLLRYSSRLCRGASGLRVELLDDPAEEWFERESAVADTLEAASAAVNEAAVAAGAGDIVVPTSAGLDSRLILALLGDRRRVRAFSYGINDDAPRSFEVVFARELARRLGVPWELVPLGWFHRYFDQWHELFGISTQAHGMYHIEFYRGLMPRVAPGSLLLSGACGDWFAGSDESLQRRARIDSVADVYAAFCWGGLVADSRRSRFRSERSGAQRLLEDQPRIRGEGRARTLAVVRLRMSLLSYLVTVPDACGLSARAPLTDIGLAMRMLTLPAHARDDRRWQREFFVRQGLDVEAAGLPVDYHNTLNFVAMRKVPLRPLDPGLLAEIVSPDYVDWVNRWVGPLGLTSEAARRLEWVRGLRRAMKVFARTGLRDRRLQAYGAYLTLRPLETFLRQREAARRGVGLARDARS